MFLFSCAKETVKDEGTALDNANVQIQNRNDDSCFSLVGLGCIDGSVEELKSFDIEQNKLISIRELNIPNNNQVNLLYRTNYVDTIEWRIYLDDFVWASFAFEDIGLVLSSTEEAPQDQSPTTTISPNPSQGISTISMTEPFTGELTITDISGQQVLNVMLEDVLEYKLDAKAMTAQTYIIRLTDESGIVETLRWVVL